MTTRIFFPLFCLLLSTSLFSQQIISKKGNGKAPYTYAGETIKPNSLGKLLADDAEAAPFAKKANGQLITGCAFAFVGGYMVGGEIGLLLANNENTRKPNVGIAVGGLVLGNIGIILGGSSNRNLSKAVHIYNKNKAEGYEGTSAVSLNLGVTDNGVGLSLRF
jgi:uncharacterized YccA/Bax inhibitor family protein